ncbi:MAG: ABC transporter permease [Burkholderiaceae bacterium]|nr:ABC transporter permease [Burkholderiaceae bacterium]
MNLWILAWRFAWSKPLSAALNVLLLALGLGALAFILLAEQRVTDALTRDVAGIDAVVGAKGSPLQLILAGVYHLDVPPGNIALADVEALRQHPQVAQLIPLSLGDNVGGHRIVGTTPGYVALYGGQLAAGQWWAQPMQAVLGAQAAVKLGLKVGDSFAGLHGLGEGGHAHGQTPYTVVGLLQPNGSVLDRLVLTATESVWVVHETDMAVDEEDRAALEAEREVTLALIRYTTPLAAVTFPRFVNTTTEMQAAAPAYELSRLLRLLGAGTDVLRALAATLLAVAGLSVFMALWQAVRERRADLALLRLLGAGPFKLAALLLAEALWLATLACGLGLLLAQGLVAALPLLLPTEAAGLVAHRAWPPQLWVVPGLALGIAVLAAALPAWGAYRADVSRLLSTAP